MITAKNLTFDYGKRPLFQGLDLDIAQGRVVGLLGRNGAGKSTLLRLMVGFVRPKGGSIELFGQPSFARRPQVMERVMMVSEDFSLPRVTITEYARIYGGLYPRFSQEQFERLLVEFSSPTFEPLSSMSFGQRKIAYLCFAIACNTELLLMDEPTNGLDIPSKSIFRRVISSLSADDRTIIISSHQVRDLDQILDHILILDDSRILVDASTSKITERLSFGRLDPSWQAIYSEQSIYGTVGVALNPAHTAHATHQAYTPNSQQALSATQTETQLDIELLFNATISSPSQIQDILR